MEKINSTIRAKTKLNQWKNSSSVISWFNGLKNKNQLQFIQFDVEVFYPSISKDLLLNAINWAKQFIDITNQEIEIILQSRKSMLFKDGTPWTKKGNNQFDVAMGAFDGAECCELIGLFILKDLAKLDIDVGIYRDDGLCVCRLSPKETEKIKKQICQIFKLNKLGIEANMKSVDFLDVNFNLSNDTFMKLNQTLHI